MYSILIDARLFDDDRLAMHDVFLLMICSATRVRVSTHSPMMYVLHSYIFSPLRCHGDRLAMHDMFLRGIDLVHVYVLAYIL